jgi:hypothetical protein
MSGSKVGDKDRLSGMKDILRWHARRTCPMLWPGVVVQIRYDTSTDLGGGFPQRLIAHLVVANAPSWILQ